MSIDIRTPAERDADNARINQAVAEEVAVGMAAKADAEHVRANALAVDAAAEASRANNFAVGAAVEAARADALGTVAARQAVHLDSARNDRDVALATAQRANRDARNSSMAFYLLLGAVGVAALIGLIWFLAKPGQSTATNAPAPPPAANRQMTPTPTVTRTVTAPPVAAPPVIIERKVVVPVDRPVAVPVPVDRPVPVVVPGPASQNEAPATTTPASETAAPATTGSGEKPLRGYVEPATGG